MANPKHVKLVRQGTGVIKAWRTAHPSEIFDLVEADLKEAQLQGADLRGANLLRANLRRANLQGANLQEANLTEADLQRADLQGAQLQGAGLSDADLWTADLRRADLKEATLWKAQLKVAYLGEANLQEADLKEANLQEASLWEAQLQGADLREADLKEANLQEANLTGAILAETNLIGAVLDGAILTNACLWETQRADWSIRGVACEAVYWDRYGDEQTTYAPGEFERLHADNTKIVLHYEGGINPIEIATLPALIQQMEERYPGCILRLRSIEDGPGGATVTLVVEESGKIAPAELARIKAELEETGQRQISALREALVVAEARRDELEKIVKLVIESVPKLIQPKYTISIPGGGPLMINDTQGDIYNVRNAGAVGRGAQARDVTFNQLWSQSAHSIDLPALAAELTTLRQAMRKEAEEPFHDKAVVEIGEAREAAQNQDGPRALQHLKNAGQWALDVATKIGVNLATEALKKALGS